MWEASYSLEGKKASVNHGGAEREELKLMKSWETCLILTQLSFSLSPLAVDVSEKIYFSPNPQSGSGGVNDTPPGLHRSISWARSGL